MNRRDAVRVVAGLAGMIWGQPALSLAASQSQQAQRPNGQGLRLVLDGQEFIEVVYRGQRVAIGPQEIIDALKHGDPTHD